jgi:hypothetical protein
LHTHDRGRGGDWDRIKPRRQDESGDEDESCTIAKLMHEVNEWADLCRKWREMSERWRSMASWFGLIGIVLLGCVIWLAVECERANEAIHEVQMKRLKDAEEWEEFVKGLRRKQ